MPGLREALFAATVKWRHVAENSRLVNDDAFSPLEQGHVNGLGDGLEMAADDVTTLLGKSDTPLTNGDKA